MAFNRQDEDMQLRCLSLIKVDIVGDFAGKELFAIHGDSLLLHCIRKAKVDIEIGFQLLHAVFAVEAFIETLNKRGCNFNIVWFSDHEKLCMPEDVSPTAKWNYCLTRAIIVKHLDRRNSDCAAGSTFSLSMHSSSFQRYLDENAIYFFLSLGGQDDEDLSHNGVQYMQLLRWLSSKGYSIAALDSLEISSSKVYARVRSPAMMKEAIELPEVQQIPRSKSVNELESSCDMLLFDSSPWGDGLPCSERDRVSLVGLTNTLLLDDRQRMKHCALAYIIHLSLLRHLDLSQRSCTEITLPTLEQKSMDEFLSSFNNICTSFVENMIPSRNWDLFDLVDGRILRQIYVNLANISLPKLIIDEVLRYANVLRQSTQVDLSRSIPQYDMVRTSNPAVALIDNSTSCSVLKFSHPVLDAFLSEMSLSTQRSITSQSTLKIFQELSHWHNARISIDKKQIPKQKTLLAMKRHQRLMNNILSYSASLTNASGKTINPETIVSEVQMKPPSKKSNKVNRGVDGKAPKLPTSHEPKHKKPAASGGRQAAMKEANLIQARKSNELLKKALSYWNRLCGQFEHETDLDSRYRKIVKYLAELVDQDMSVIRAEASLYLCNCLALIIHNARKHSKKIDEMGLMAIIWSKLLDIDSLPLSNEGVDLFKLFAAAVKFPASVAPDASLKGRKLPFRHIMAILGNKLSIPLSSLHFQLLHCGPYLERGFDSAPDPRVLFNPDAWQRKVLDAIDANQSLFVVAPTSAGKTFLSFYAMKKVLQSNDDDVLVYVAPTKALVNQIAAEVQARFSKSYKNAGSSVWAIHTRDYRINSPKGCQVLITVPHILQILLLHPSNSSESKAWSLRIKRIIFDEVHCIGQADDGVIWEQLLLIAPCPIIALSATVGNPEDFRAWLETSEKAKGHELTMIAHSSRYSDLRKFVYHLPIEQNFQGLKSAEGIHIPGLDEGQHAALSFSHVHPVATLVNRNRGKLNDINLEPRDCFVLWKYMSKHQTKDFCISDNLNPEHSFSGIIKKSDVTKWEAALKRVMERWIQAADSPFPSLRADLQSLTAQSAPVNSKTPKVKEPTSAKSVDPGTEASDLRNAALPLLTDLHRHESLPAILFNYDRTYCERILCFVNDQLKVAEDKWKADSPAWQRKIAKFEEWKRSGVKSKQKVNRTGPNQRRQDEGEHSKLDSMQDEADKDISRWESFDPEAPLEMFSFADRTKMLDSEFEIQIERLKWQNLKPEILGALRRGLGVHHAGMNREYRQIVEMLFRKGYLRVVIATGTLALGINMPCKSIVFFGDSVFLTALNYNQCAGRAGRRGFDVLGNVVFVGLRPERVFEIMSSRLPDLRGQFPLSTTLVLRLMGLLHHTNNSPYAVRIMKSLQVQSRLFLGGPSDQMSIKHHLRFSIEYLRRQDLLSEHGAPLNFAGLVGHLYFTENAVFAFHSLLRGGYFHRICRNINRTKYGVSQQLMLILSHLFGRIPLRMADAKAITDKEHRSPSIVVLPALPKAAEDILTEHNKETLHIFRNYVGSFVEQHLYDQPDNQLPLTNCAILKKTGADTLEASSFLDIVPPTKLRSAFAALSGFTDEFESIHDLCTTVRAGVFLEESAVPYIPLYPNDDANMHWNAYLYDFFKHGSLEALVRYNGIKAGDVWFHLKDFSLVLAAIVTTLQNSHGSAVQQQSTGPPKPDDLEESWDSEMKPEISSQDENTSRAQDNEGGGPADALTESEAEEDGKEAEKYDAEESLANILLAFMELQSQFNEAFYKVGA
ncbi:hypothetical protein E4U51_007000 [Claviceps purpurea]|nr:hypothetical protein E4U51_007000 [Claviceps purpurea]